MSDTNMPASTKIPETSRRLAPSLGTAIKYPRTARLALVIRRFLLRRAIAACVLIERGFDVVIAWGERRQLVAAHSNYDTDGGRDPAADTQPAEVPDDRMAGNRGQTTAEYALVLLGAATVALLVLAWAANSGKVQELLDRVFDSIISKVT